jgi:hypothetical protein
MVHQLSLNYWNPNSNFMQPQCHFTLHTYKYRYADLHKRYTFLKDLILSQLQNPTPVTLTSEVDMAAILVSLIVKVKLSLCLTKSHAMKTYWGSGGIASCILEHSTRWRCCQLHTLVTLPPRKEPLVPIR